MLTPNPHNGWKLSRKKMRMKTTYLLTNFYSQRNLTILTDIFYRLEFFVRQNFGGREK